MTEFFQNLLANDRVHAAFLNSLSYLEYRGARKIARALSSADIDPEVLQHAYEESRHALYFKSLALKIGGADFRAYEDRTLLSAAAVKTYFHRLDHAVGRIARLGAKDRYLWTTWLVEERALEIYTLYDSLLAQAKPEIRLTSVLKDEAHHLDFVRERVNGPETKSLRAFEADLFFALRSELQRALGNKS